MTKLICTTEEVERWKLEAKIEELEDLLFNHFRRLAMPENQRDVIIEPFARRIQKLQQQLDALGGPTE